MSHDPKLKEAMAEILGVLKKHDIAGDILLVSQTHAETRFKIDPSWSCAHPEAIKDGVAIRFKARKQDIPDRETRKELIEKTAHIIFQMTDHHARNFMAFEHVTKELHKVVEIEHHQGKDYEPHREQ